MPNQTDHRRNYYKRVEAGLIQPGRNRQRRRGRSARRPRDPKPDPGKPLTIAERLGLDLPAKPKAKPLTDLSAPPPTANVPETAEPEVQVDPPQADVGELPPVAELAPADEPTEAPPEPEVRVDPTDEAPDQVIEPEAEAEEEEERQPPLV